MKKPLFSASERAYYHIRAQVQGNSRKLKEKHLADFYECLVIILGESLSSEEKERCQDLLYDIEILLEKLANTQETESLHKHKKAKANKWHKVRFLRTHYKEKKIYVKIPENMIAPFKE